MVEQTCEVGCEMLRRIRAGASLGEGEQSRGTHRSTTHVGHYRARSLQSARPIKNTTPPWGPGGVEYITPARLRSSEHSDNGEWARGLELGRTPEDWPKTDSLVRDKALVSQTSVARRP